MRKLLLLTIVSILYFAGCSASAENAVGTKQELQPVRVLIDNTYYLLPECSRYDKIRPNKLLEMPTIQEAEFSGYRPAPCSKTVRDQRLQKEREIYGEIKSTKEMETRRIQVAALEKLRDIESDQDDARAEAERRQEEIADKQRELEEKQVEIEDKQRDMEMEKIFDEKY